MSDLISRQAAIDAFMNATADGDKAEWCKMVIEHLPTATERKTGEWTNYEGMLRCSACGAEFYNDVMEYFGDDVPRYCPNCGADMRGDNNE